LGLTEFRLIISQQPKEILSDRSGLVGLRRGRGLEGIKGDIIVLEGYRGYLSFIGGLSG